MTWFNYNPYHVNSFYAREDAVLYMHNRCRMDSIETLRGVETSCIGVILCTSTRLEVIHMF